MNLIAETAWHHDGDIDFLKKLVNTICDKTECDYIKFHVTLDLEEYIQIAHPIYEWAKERLFSEEEWSMIFKLTREKGKKIMLLFNDQKAIKFGMKFNPDLVEIHSLCLNDLFLLKCLKKEVRDSTKIVLGIGGTDIEEINNALNVLDNKNIVLMHGFQNYPTEYRDVNLLKIKKIIDLYPNIEHGYADHTAWDHEHNTLISLIGASAGMKYLEKHVTISTGEGRSDWQAAISIKNFIEIQEKLKILDDLNGNGLLEMNKGEISYSRFGFMKKAAVLIKDISQGDSLSFDNFRFKRTAKDSNLSQLDVIKNIGKVFKNDLKKDTIINHEDFE